MHFPTILSFLPLAAAFPVELPSLHSLLPRALTDTTQNDLTNGSPCKALTVLFARGTDSPGNVGTNTGPAFFQAIASLIGANNVAIQGIDYPASIIGFLQGGTQCPNTKVVLSGYSQGGQLVHKAAKQLSAAVAAKVSSVLIFGDPDNGTPVGTIPSSKVLVICHSKDEICKGSIIVTSDHLNYSNDAGTAAAFVVKAAGM